MSDIVVPGFKSSELIAELSKVFDAYSPEEKAALIKKVNGVFEFVIKNADGKTETFTVDCKKEGKVTRGKGKQKADAILTLKDQDFVDLATGKLNGQKAYMSGKLKIKGQIMLAMKLDSVFKSLNPTAKL
ncbi:SCP2 sterol-binding domain-containing protein [Radiomyces spectabilis]|uniref:SCP2 sterol-binding domain-containing protein n=1 Tax=Radiomyces spectabilis TaxID=64574 RepID=UPI0022211D15|nr:SCP2 sterol-binding domain-containing protein [Radiomyces spectabilis]KAI8388463.1 SCP2 sterol-binding domain-containing protein [Radiomyces spectabilis]